jgi:uncharacterized protein involved in outer membrane biogenesis
MRISPSPRKEKTMKKWFFVGIALVVIIAAVLIIGISNLGPIIKTAVNKYGPAMTKTDLRVKDVNISLFSGKATLKDFYLGNPKGFKSPEAMSVNAIYVDVNEKSITRDPIIIDRIEVVGPNITYEKVRSTDNFQTILSNVKRSADTSKSSSSSKKSSKESTGKKFVIRDLIITDGKVNMDVEMRAGSSISASASLPKIHLKNVGEKSGGATAEEVFHIVFAELYDKIVSPAVTATLNKEFKGLTSRIPIEDEETKKSVEKTVNEKVKGLLGK